MELINIIQSNKEKVRLKNLNEELLMAAKGLNIEEIKKLITQGASPNHFDDWLGVNPIINVFHSLGKTSEKILALQTLIELGANINFTYGPLNRNLLQHLCKMPEAVDSEILDFLVTHKININHQDKYQQTPLMSAVDNGDLNLVKKFLEYGADINLMDKEKENSIFKAIHFSNSDYSAKDKRQIVKELLKHNPILEAKNINGYTALYQIISGDLTFNADCFNFLLEAGANPHTLVHNHNLATWAFQKQPFVLKQLIDLGVYPDENMMVAFCQHKPRYVSIMAQVEVWMIERNQKNNSGSGFPNRNKKVLKIL